MKKYFMIMICFVLFVFTGCEDLDKHNPNANNEKIGTEIIRCFKEKDTEGLKSMFCSKISNSHDLDSEISAAMDFMEGEIESYEISAGTGWSYDVDSGEWTRESIKPHINIETSVGKKYRVPYGYVLINRDNPDHEGMFFMKIIDTESEEERVEIGGDLV